MADWRAVTPVHPDYDDTGSTSFGAPNVDYNSANGTFITIQDVSALRANTNPNPPGDFDGDGLLTAADIDELSEAVRLGSVDLKYDLDANQTVDEQDRTVWVKQLRRTYFGDADLNGEFNTNDFVAVLQSGQYEDGITRNSGWATGDWSGDAEFDTADLVRALQDGGYESGPLQAVAAVPEPQGFLLFLGTVLGLIVWHRAR